LNVTKRDGSVEPVNLDKIHRVITWGAEGLDVSVSQVELNAHLQLFDGIKTSDIHALIVKSAADLITAETPDYQYLAARLKMFALRKEAYGQFEPPHLRDHIERMIELGRYEDERLPTYGSDELEWLNGELNHSRDFTFTYAATVQWESKYLVQDRVDERVYESPQMAYMAQAMVLHANYPDRLDRVRRYYHACSTFKISLPTPIMGGVRTPTKQFSSCVKIDIDDSLDSIIGGVKAAVKYISQRAGLGLNIGRIRGVGSKVRNGDVYHTGVLPFLKLLRAAVKSCSQGGARGGAATVFYPLWHIEAEQLLVLKNNRGTEETRERHLDYGVQLNRTMYERLLTGGNITLFSPADTPGLYDAYFGDPDHFATLYEMYEADPTLRKKTVKAVDLFSSLVQERAQTGRIYVMNADHMNTHSAFTDTVYMSNLCMEIALPTTPADISDEPSLGSLPEVALCTLAAVNLGACSEEDIPEVTELIVYALDALLSYQDYPIREARAATARRSLGVGITNYAYYLAKNGVKYSDGSANNLTHRLMEQLQFHLLAASNRLAQDVGACAYFHRTKYAKGLLPIDTYKRDVDSICSEPLHCDWEGLRRSIEQFGLRNSTVTALMPCETSSQITNSTNGIEPPRGLVSTKGNKDGLYKQVVPEIGQVDYELLWDIPNNRGYLELVAIMQKFVDQSISANTNYDPSRFADGRVPVQVLLQDLALAYKLGIKTLYYHNTRDGSDTSEDDGCAGGACKL
jgi:ribonucleoside-diphosphate reductase alpha chain